MSVLPNSSTRSFDAIVIGTGQSGPPLAVRLGAAGWKVAIIERGRFGGTCVNNGCTPTKTLIASAYAAHMARRAADYGVETGAVKVDMPQVKARKDARFGTAAEAIPIWKRRRIAAMALDYLAWSGRTNQRCRIDVVAIDGIGTLDMRVRVIENAFGAGGR